MFLFQIFLLYFLLFWRKIKTRSSVHFEKTKGPVSKRKKFICYRGCFFNLFFSFTEMWNVVFFIFLLISVVFVLFWSYFVLKVFKQLLLMLIICIYIINLSLFYRKYLFGAENVQQKAEGLLFLKLLMHIKLPTTEE